MGNSLPKWWALESQALSWQMISLSLINSSNSSFLLQMLLDNNCKILQTTETSHWTLATWISLLSIALPMENTFRLLSITLSWQLWTQRTAQLGQLLATAIFWLRICRRVSMLINTHCTLWKTSKTLSYGMESVFFMRSSNPTTMPSQLLSLSLRCHPTFTKRVRSSTNLV